MKRLIPPNLVFGGILAVSSIALWEADARACGGCFNPPESPTVVTDHRMIFSISAQQSTLYDQIQYTGAPESFGWVLPYSGEIEVGVSSDVLFQTIDALTQTQVLPPPRNCPAAPASCPRVNYTSGGSGEDASGVDVVKREVVGPYDTAQLRASDPAALETWLSTNGFSLPDAVKPVVAAYVGEKFNFLALKLVPGQGVQAMKPVRVTTKGSNVALPLRMIAAGTGATVGITLWIVAEGRYQPSNFDLFQIKSEDLAWDWTQNKSNYIDIRAQKNAAAQGRAWELESVTQLDQPTLFQGVDQGGPSRPGPYAAPDGGTNAAGYAADGQKTAETVQYEDSATLFAHMPGGIAKLTRIRADLDHAALDRDLTLQASTDQTLVDRTRQVTKELNEPLCPVYDGCESTTSAPRSQAVAKTNESKDDGCATTSSRPSGTWIALGVGALGLAWARRKRNTT
jgi:MYXO-CTERM domain-containing protein